MSLVMRKKNIYLWVGIIISIMITIFLAIFLDPIDASGTGKGVYLCNIYIILSIIVAVANLTYYLYKKDVFILAIAIRFSLAAGLYFSSVMNYYFSESGLLIIEGIPHMSEMGVISNVSIALLIIYVSIHRKVEFKLDSTKSASLLLAAAFLGALMLECENYIIDHFISGENTVLICTLISLIIIALNLIILFLLYSDYKRSKSIYLYVLVISYLFLIIGEMLKMLCSESMVNITFLGDLYKIASYALPLVGMCMEFINNMKVLHSKVEEEKEYQSKLFKYFSIIQESSNIVAIINEVGEPEYLNPVARRALGICGALNDNGEPDLDKLNILTIEGLNYRQLIERATKEKEFFTRISMEVGDEIKYLTVNIYPIEDKIYGKTNYALILNDETDTVLLTESLLKGEKKFRNITNNIFDLICQLDYRGNIKYCSPSYTAVFGGIYEYYQNIPWVHNVLGEDVDMVIDDINKCLNCRETITNECRMVIDNWSKNEVIWVEYLISPLTDDEKRGAMISARDITRRKLAEEERERESKKLQEALQYDELRTEFFSNISHELRTPINVIFSIVQVVDLENHNNNNCYGKYNNVLKQNCYRLLRLINNLIDITKIDAGYLKLTIGKYDIIKLVEDITQSVVAYATTKNIELLFDTEEEELEIYCDPDKIERIVLNLLSNAIKFTPSKGNILVYMSREADDVVLKVKDSGIGIPEDMLDVVFERFRQVDKSLTRQNEGSGIGLSLLKSLVELHGGTVTVTSELNKGSEFIVRLPIYYNKQFCEEDRVIDRAKNNIETINIEFSDIYDVL